ELPAGTIPILAQSAGVRWISLDAPVKKSTCYCDDGSTLASDYVRAIGADRLWADSPALHGEGVTVAIVDSGVSKHPDLGGDPASDKYGYRLNWGVSLSDPTRSGTDTYGHGTHVAGIIGGN